LLGHYLVFGEIIHPHRFKSAIADVQRDLRDRNPFRFNAFEYFRREMQPGGRGGDRTAFTCVF
jgi:hypothetical protein